METIDINCDMGEGVGNEALLMPYISSANIACGYHAGDEATMKRVIELCLQYNVAIGAHPSFPDKENFGRTEMDLPPEQIHDFIIQQLEVLNKAAATYGTRLHHVKPHGALYNMAAKDISIAHTVATAVKAFDASLIYYGLSGSPMITTAEQQGLKTANEVFADRTYQPGGLLTPRKQANALIEDDITAVLQVMQMIKNKTVTAVNGNRISIKADTICLHGDGNHAVSFAKSLYNSLQQENIHIQRINS
ncbi:MAG: 5-oxoprolinase subunit PxpA [Ferruginibacter sp.]